MTGRLESLRRGRLDRRRLGRLAERLRWVLLLVAAGVIAVFLIAQRQSANVTYGQSPVPTLTGNASGGPSLPPVAELTARVAANPVVRLPGAIAQWDAAAVAAAIGPADVRILVAPPGLTEDQRDQLETVDNATVVVVGTRVAGGGAEAVASTLADNRDQFGRDDITGQLLALIPSLTHQTGPRATPSADPWRDPTPAELSTVVSGLRAGRLYVAPGATVSAAPAGASRQAFDTDTGLYVALPAQPRDTPAPRYGPALAAVFPGVPIVVLYGDWIEYTGPHADEFAQVAGASFYGRFGELLSRSAYPQDGVLGAYLGTVTAIRSAGLFDRPLPYQPLDPLRVALPVLPWLFALCVIGFLALSARSLLRPATAASAAAHRLATVRRTGIRAQLAGLTALAVEVSGLTDAATNAPLTRAISQLQAARAALDDGRPDRGVRALLNDAETELDQVGAALDFPGFRPEAYLRGRLA